MDKIRYGFVVLVSIIIGVLPLNAKTLTDVITYETMGLKGNNPISFASTSNTCYNVTFTTDAVAVNPTPKNSDSGIFKPAEEMITSGAEYYATMLSASLVEQEAILRFKYFVDGQSESTVFKSTKSPGIVNSVTILGINRNYDYYLEIYGLTENGNSELIDKVYKGTYQEAKKIEFPDNGTKYTNLAIKASLNDDGSYYIYNIGGFKIEWEVPDTQTPAFAEETMTVPFANRNLCSLQQLSGLSEGTTVTYSSLNPSVAEIADEGNGQKLNIRTPGRTTITATCSNGFSASYQLIVESAASFTSSGYQRVTSPLLLATTGKYAIVSGEGKLYDGNGNSTIVSDFNVASETCDITGTKLPDVSFEYDSEHFCYLIIDSNYMDGTAVGELNTAEGMEPSHRVTLSADNHITWPETALMLCFDSTSGQLITAASDAVAVPALLYRNVQPSGSPLSPSVTPGDNGISPYELGYSASKEGSYWYIYFDEDSFNLKLTADDPENEDIWYRYESGPGNSPRRLATANNDNDGYTQFNDGDNITLSKGSYTFSFYSFNPTTGLKSPVERLSVEIQTKVNEINSETATPIYYNVNGLRVDNPGKGILIRRDGDKTAKNIR